MMKNRKIYEIVTFALLCTVSPLIMMAEQSYPNPLATTGQSDSAFVANDSVASLASTKKIDSNSLLVMRSESARKRISKYDHLFIRQAKNSKWDWQLLAAIAHQESKFHTHLTGPNGAVGLMGIMPSTGRIFGESRKALRDPSTSIQVAIKCLNAAASSFAKVKNDKDLLSLSLATYNGGIGHVRDAQALAKKYEGVSTKWTIVAKYLKLLSKPKYYNDPVCRFGRVRGHHIVQYVNSIHSKYETYKSLTELPN